MATYGRKFSVALFASFMLTLSSIHHQVACQDTGLLLEQKKALYKFFEAVNKSNCVNWNMSKPVCDWKGIKCDSSKSYVDWIQLPAKSLLGQIPNNTIGNVTTLVSLSLHHNGLTGPIPSDFSKLEQLVQFTLHNNFFSGQLPELNLKNINRSQFDVSNNNLSGCIPESLSSLENSSFDRNNYLCGPPLTRSCNCIIPTTQPPALPPAQPPASPKNKSNDKLPTGAIVGIAIGSPALLNGITFTLQYKIRASIRRSSSSKDQGEKSKKYNKKVGGLKCLFWKQELVKEGDMHEQEV